MDNAPSHDTATTLDASTTRRPRQHELERISLRRGSRRIDDDDASQDFSLDISSKGRSKNKTNACSQSTFTRMNEFECTSFRNISILIEPDVSDLSSLDSSSRHQSRGGSKTNSLTSQSLDKLRQASSRSFVSVAEARLRREASSRSLASLQEGHRTSVDVSIHSYEDLRKVDFCPAGVDPKYKEHALSKEEFMSVFGMSRVVFQGLPKWKRDYLKKTKDLFY